MGKGVTPDIRYNKRIAMMTDKQNSLEIIRFGKPERLVTQPPGHRTAYFGANHEDPAGGPGNDGPIGTKWTDIWGAGWEKEQDGVMAFPRHHPLADPIAALKTYVWPNPDDDRICAWVYEKAKGHDRTATFLSGSHRETLWEKSYVLGGMENMMCAFYTEPEMVREILHRIMDFQLGIARHYLAVGIEIANLGDDLGTQLAPILSPDLIREFLVPEYRRLFELYHRHGVMISFHSCGNITPILDIFMELKVDILNPLQATANDLGEVRRLTAGKMCLHGGVRSDLIASGPIPAIRREARRQMWNLGRNGGYFCSPDQAMPWPEEHHQALVDAVAEYGRYPLSPPAA